MEEDFTPLPGIDYDPNQWSYDLQELVSGWGRTARTVGQVSGILAGRAVKRPLIAAGLAALVTWGVHDAVSNTSHSKELEAKNERIESLETEVQRLADYIEVPLREIATIRSERSDAAAYTEALEAKVDEYETDLRSFFMFANTMEATPFSFDIEDYEPILRRRPNLRPVAEEFMPIAEEMFNEGYEVLHPVYYLARFMVESGGRTPWVRGPDGELRVSSNKDFLDRFFTSNRAATGIAQVTAPTGKNLGLTVIEDDSYKEGFELNPQVRAAQRSANQARNSLLEVAGSDAANRGERLIELADIYRTRAERAEELGERRDSLFRYYEELVLDSIAGKPVSVVAEFEERMTPEASARATILHDHFSRYQIRGDPDVASAIYLSGSDNVLWSTNSVYIMNIRQQMKQMFGWLANDDVMRFTWRIPASLQEDSDIKAGVSSDTP